MTTPTRPILPLFGAILALFGLLVATSAWADDGMASFYTTKSCQKEGTSGVWTASGERFDENALTCARRSRTCGKEWYVYSHKTGKSIIVRQNDFGPGKGPTAKGVIIDLTLAGFKALGVDLKDGKTKVSVMEISG